MTNGWSQPFPQLSFCRFILEVCSNVLGDDGTNKITTMVTMAIGQGFTTLKVWSINLFIRHIRLTVLVMYDHSVTPSSYVVVGTYIGTYIMYTMYPQERIGKMGSLRYIHPSWAPSDLRTSFGKHWPQRPHSGLTGQTLQLLGQNGG